MNITKKLLAALLISVFIASIGAVVAEDVADADKLAADDTEETISVSDESSETLEAEDNTEALAAESSDETQSAPADEDATDVDIKVEVLDKNPKVGDTVRVKLTLTNLGSNAAKNVQAQFSFTDIYENLDYSFKLIDSDHDVDEFAGGYVITLDSLAGASTEEIILTFLATTSGSKTVVASVFSDNSMEAYYDNDTFTVSESSSANSNAQSKAAKMHATGNPLALLALSLLCIIPYYRRN